MPIPISSIQYDAVKTFSTLLRGQKLEVITKMGMPGWDRIDPPNLLMAEKVGLPDAGNVLVLGCSHGALAAAFALSAPGCRFYITDTNLIALKMSAQTLNANQVSNAEIIAGLGLPIKLDAFINGTSVDDASIDLAVMLLPKGRKLVRRWLLQAYTSLREGGGFYLAGANNEGILTAVKDAQELFGSPVTIAYKKGNRIIRFGKLRQPHSLPDWVGEPGIAPQTWEDFTVLWKNRALHLSSLPGVFSSGKLDEGTRLLLDFMQVEPGARVLDLGCGYGMIGILAALSGAGYVDLVDANLHAVAAARRNLAQLGLQNAQALASDALEAIRINRYQQVFTNPPFHTGKAQNYSITRAFIQGAFEVLLSGGQLMLVANRFIRYQPWLKEVFPQVELLAQNGKYQLFSAHKSSNA